MIKVCGAKYVVFGVSDPGKTRQFMTDFGLAPVEWHGDSAYLRGALPAPYVYVAEKSDAPSLKAFGLEVESAEDLERATRIEGASAMRELDRPGGGRVVDVLLPGGLRIELVHADGDLYDSSVPATTVEGTHEQLWAWGPEVPQTFFKQTRET